MRVFLMAAIAVAALSASAIEAAQAQSNCPVTETRSTGPNGETIIRREACGAVEITTVGGTSSTTSTTSSTRNRTTTNTPPPNQPPATNNGATNTPSSNSSVMTVPGRNVGLSNLPPPAPGNMGGGWGPANVPDPMAMNRPMARIVLFDANNFRGRSIGITQNTPDLQRRRFSDVASAARSQGGVWELCSEPNYGGTCVRTDTDLVLDAAGVDNTIASVRLVGP